MGGTVDISSAYHHIHMHENSTTFLGFEREGSYYFFTVLRFWLSTASRIFTLVMSHCVLFLQSVGVELLSYRDLDYLIFAHATPRKAHILPVHPTKCTGVSEELSSFRALGTLVNLATQTYHVPPDTIKRIVSKATAMATVPSPFQSWQLPHSRGSSARHGWPLGLPHALRTRAIDAMIALRPAPRSRSKMAIHRRGARGGHLSSYPPPASKRFACR
jgi:hypothetical protein